jgi:hypothetical protein
MSWLVLGVFNDIVSKLELLASIEMPGYIKWVERMKKDLIMTYLKARFVCLLEALERLREKPAPDSLWTGYFQNTNKMRYTCEKYLGAIRVTESQIRDFFFVASYDSQGYGGGIRPRLHMGYPLLGYSGTSYNSSARTT